MGLLNNILCYLFGHKWLMKTDGTKLVYYRCGKENKIR